MKSILIALLFVALVIQLSVKRPQEGPDCEAISDPNKLTKIILVSAAFGYQGKIDGLTWQQTSNAVWHYAQRK